MFLGMGAWYWVGTIGAIVFVGFMVLGPSIIEAIGKMLPADKKHKDEVPEVWARTKRT